MEGVQKSGDEGSGFNSEDYRYQFFTVTNYTTGLLDKVELNISNLTTNTGIAKTIQDSFATIINSKNYPSFEVVQKSSQFIIGEKIVINDIETDLTIQDYGKTFIKVFGSYELSNDQIVKGNQSGNIAIIDNIEYNSGRFDVDYSVRKDLGLDNIGKLDQDNQVIANNDYYQNLSYSIKSPIPWETLSSPVNSILHPAGMKNFADVGITSSVGISPMIGVSTSIVILDVFSEKRVDTINYFDNSLDIDVRGSQSKFLKLQNTKLSDYTECKTNRVLC